MEWCGKLSGRKHSRQQQGSALPLTSRHCAVPLCTHSSAKNLDNTDKVAIKKIANAFDNIIDAKRTLREIKLLRHLQHENVVQIRDIIPPSKKEQFKDLYVVYELMDTDLHQIIRSPQPLSNDHSQYFLYQASGMCVCPCGLQRQPGGSGAR